MRLSQKVLAQPRFEDQVSETLVTKTLRFTEENSECPFFLYFASVDPPRIFKPNLREYVEQSFSETPGWHSEGVRPPRGFASKISKILFRKDGLHPSY